MNAQSSGCSRRERWPARPARATDADTDQESSAHSSPAPEPVIEDRVSTREKLRSLLRAGRLDKREVELETTQQHTPVVEIFSAAGMEEMDINLKDMFGGMFPKKTKKRMAIKHARNAAKKAKKGWK